MAQDTEIIHYRLTQLEGKVDKIDGKLLETILTIERIKPEIEKAVKEGSSKQSTAVSAIVSVAVTVIGVIISKGLGL